MAGRLDGQVAVVTGSGRGIGRAYAKALAAEGASVVVNDNGSEMNGKGHSKEPADKVVEEIVERGGKAVASYEDVSKHEQAVKIVQTAKERFGRLDLMMTNAGADRRGFVLDLGPEDFEATLGTHVFGSIYCAVEAAKVMRDQGGGAIITITSGAFYGGTMRLAPYVVSKGSTYSLMRALSQELEKFNISVNAIAPGFTKTRATIEYLRGIATDEKDPERAKRMEAGFQDPEAMAPLAVYLATPEGRRITGHAFTIGGSNQLAVIAPPTVATTVYSPTPKWDAESLIKALSRAVAPTMPSPQQR